MVHVAVRRYRLRHEGDEVDVVGPFIVGREHDCQLVIDDPMVSRRHARFYVGDEGLMVEDLGSKNGVLVNDRRIDAPTLLAHGDVVGCGLVSCQVVDATFSRRKQKPTRPMPFSKRDVDGPEPITISPRIELLSDREREVFELIVFGHTQREIADKLHISVKTIETHRARIADKLCCRTRAELVAYAVSAGVFARPTG